ncbi:MAG: hypothetical protein V7K62_01270 [Nostoc sp.]
MKISLSQSSVPSRYFQGRSNLEEEFWYKVGDTPTLHQNQYSEP